MLISGYTDRSNLKELKNMRLPCLGKANSVSSESRKYYNLLLLIEVCQRRVLKG